MEKPAEILKLEEFYNRTILEIDYTIDSDNQVVLLNLSSSSNIEDIEPLKELKFLKILFLSGNQISNIEPLKELKLLTTLSL